LFSIILPLSLNKEEKRVGRFAVGGLFLLEMRAASFFTADGCWLSTERERKRKTSAPKAFVLSKARVKVARKLLFSRRSIAFV
jgi:hypothetical protein